MIMQRENEIISFVSEGYSTLRADLGSFQVTWREITVTRAYLTRRK